MNDIDSTFATYVMPVPYVNTTNAAARKYYYGGTARTTVSPVGATSGIYGLTASSNNSIAFVSSGNNNYGNSGLNILSENPDNYNTGMISYISSKHDACICFIFREILCV